MEHKIYIPCKKFPRFSMLLTTKFCSSSPIQTGRIQMHVTIATKLPMMIVVTL